ncbi:MAG: aquaporin [Candidatus Accumulibacter sp.]|jgi:hypothetical protein|nr:aquaporin [Accumulibacter sp.]
MYENHFDQTPDAGAPLAVFSTGSAIRDTTGCIINPARDLDPRMKGKGSSDWGHAWIPIAGPVIGAILGGIAAKAIMPRTQAMRWMPFRIRSAGSAASAPTMTRRAQYPVRNRIFGLRPIRRERPCSIRGRPPSIPPLPRKFKARDKSLQSGLTSPHFSIRIRKIISFYENIAGGEMNSWREALRMSTGAWQEPSRRARGDWFFRVWRGVNPGVNPTAGPFQGTHEVFLKPRRGRCLWQTSEFVV